MVQEAMSIFFLVLIQFNLNETKQSVNTALKPKVRNLRIINLLELLNFKEISPQAWTPQTSQHFSRTTLLFQCDELRLHLPERAETFPSVAGGKHGKL